MTSNIILASTTSSSTNVFDMILKYSDVLANASLVLVGVILVIVYYVRTKMFSNTSKVEKLDVTKVKILPAKDLVTISDVSNNMYIEDTQNVYTGVIETTGIPYSTLSGREKDNVNSGYIGFLNAINFRFSKHIISRKIDIEKTESIYQLPLTRSIEKLEDINMQIESLEKKLKNDSIDLNDEKSLKKLYKNRKLEEENIKYLQHQINYLEVSTSNIHGSTKSVYYSASGELDEEALKGLSPNEVIEAYEANVFDRITAMSNSLAGIGVKSNRLNDIELLDLARTHYKPYSSGVFKTKHLLNNSSVEDDYVLNKELFTKILLNAALMRGEQKSDQIS
ncbi:MAG: hypothetical protein IBX70_07765 [Clostridia bacterium]|nr:hypothetical protein [Clostridia bacterium]